jgi:uncharacterized protein (DUF1800 family)
MKRRDLLLNLSEKDKITSESLEEYTEKLDYARALHLLRRLTFHPKPEQVGQIVGKTAAEAMSIILGTGTEPLPEPTESMKSWLDTLEENPLDNLPQDIRAEIESRHKVHYAELSNWWLDLMYKDNFPSIEKLVMFLHSIWCIEFTYDTLALLPPPLLYRNNVKLRQLRFEAYNKIAEEVTLDGAMLLYQSLFYSGKEVPNENYMRELMELFSMGIGDLGTGESNYTEGDIREGARALTGWRTVAYLGQEGAPANKPFETFFIKTQHDTGGKKIMQFGEIAPITDDENTEDLVKLKEVKGLVDILFNERGLAISRFISEKILRFFVYSDPGGVNNDILNGLAGYMAGSSYSLRQVFIKLFTSKYFFSNEVRGCQIKTPLEYIVGIERILSIDSDSISNGRTRESVFTLEQLLYDPPNVGSWKAYRSWIGTTTYPLRIKYANELINKMSDSQLIDFIKKFPSSATNFDQMMSALTLFMLPVPLSQDRLDGYTEIILNSLTKSEWMSGLNSSNSKVSEGIRLFLLDIVSSPDFQLC